MRGRLASSRRRDTHSSGSPASVTLGPVNALFLEVLKGFAPLVAVLVGGLITWRSGLHFRRLDRRAESRAAVVGAIEETISATLAFRDDLANWLGGGWGRPESRTDPRLPALTAHNGELKRHSSEGRGRLRAALAKLIVLTNAEEDLSEASALVDDAITFGESSDQDLTLVEKAKVLRVRSRKLAETWRDTMR